jgi:hypothetical protein
MAFIVRTWYADSARGYDEITIEGLDAAIARAREFSDEGHVRSALVMDDTSTIWAQFNMLWMIPAEAR